MTTADDRHDEDVWAEAVAEGARATPQPRAELDHEPGEGRTGREEVVKPAAAPTPVAPGRAAAELFGSELSPLVEEVRRLATTVGEKVSAASASVSSGDHLGALQDLAAPLRVKHPEVYGHLIAAGGELIAAYRSAVSASEKRWTAEKPKPSEQIDLD
jgi:hypothetical protein